MIAGYLLFCSFENHARKTGRTKQLGLARSSSIPMYAHFLRVNFHCDIPELDLLHTTHSRSGHGMRGKEKECNRAQRGEERKEIFE